MTLSIYLHYAGNCREAFEFYRSVFGGEFDIMTTFAEGPPDMGVTEDERDNVLHVSYTIGSSVLMGSDVPSQFGPSAGGRQQLRHQLLVPEQGGDRRPVRQDLRGR